MAASFYMYANATGAAGSMADSCGWASPYLGVWWVALLLAPLPLLVCVARETCRGGGGARWPWSREDIVPFLLIVFPVYAFVVAHAAGWWGACDVPAQYAATLASAGGVLSGVVFVAYWDVYGASGKGPFRNPTVLACIMAAASFAYYAFRVTDGWGLPNEAVRLFLAEIALVAVAVASSMFGAEYVKNRGQSRRRDWALPIALIVAGALGYYAASGQDGWGVGDSDDIWLYVAQSMWAGMAVGGVMLGVRAAVWLPKKHPMVLIGPTIMLAVLASPHHDILNDLECLISMDRCADPSDLVRAVHTLEEHTPHEHIISRMQIYVAIMLSILILFAAMANAMLEAAMTARIGPKRTP